jgi:CheY-like chemotaxis protein
MDGVYTALSLFESSKKLQLVRINTIIYDLTGDPLMPGLSGLDLIREVKSRPQTASIPVILLTSLETFSPLLAE